MIQAKIKMRGGNLKIRGRVRVWSHLAGTDFRTHGKLEVEQKNLIMDSPNYGFDILIQRLVGLTTYSGTITFGEIGTGNTAVAIGDTALTASSVRAAVSFSEDYGNTDAIVQFYFPDGSLTNQTYYEFGTFIDGSSTPGSGQLFNHALFTSPYAKVSGQDTTVEVDFNFSNG